MKIKIMPAGKGDDGERRFLFAIVGDDGRLEKIIHGTEPGEHGMSEPKFRTVLAEHGLSPADVDRAVQLALNDGDVSAGALC